MKWFTYKEYGLDKSQRAISLEEEENGFFLSSDHGCVGEGQPTWKRELTTLLADTR